MIEVRLQAQEIEGKLLETKTVEINRQISDFDNNPCRS